VRQSNVLPEQLPHQQPGLPFFCFLVIVGYCSRIHFSALLLQPTVILKAEKARHLQVCPLVTVTCEICQKTHLRQDTEAHITQNVFSHFTALADQLKQTKAEVTSLKREVEDRPFADQYGIRALLALETDD
jgi:hypothetical protein